MAAIRDILQAKISQPLMTRLCQRRAWADELTSEPRKRGLQLEWVRVWIRFFLFKKQSCQDYTKAYEWAVSGKLLDAVTTRTPMGGDPSWTIDDFILKEWWEGSTPKQRKEAVEADITVLVFHMHPDAEGLSLDEVANYHYNGERKIVLSKARNAERHRDQEASLAHSMRDDARAADTYDDGEGSGDEEGDARAHGRSGGCDLTAAGDEYI